MGSLIVAFNIYKSNRVKTLYKRLLDFHFSIQILLNIQIMKTAIILIFLGLFGALTDACCRHNCNGNNGRGLGRMGSEITDDTVEPLAYAVCNTDGVEGLSWAEVEQCEEAYCKDLPFDCPTKADFDFFDADGNGILTWAEWKSLHG